MAKTICASWFKSVGKTQKSPTKMSNTQDKDVLTFDQLLVKYAGKIMQATSEELRRVKNNGLKELFAALRRYSLKNGR